MISEHAFPASAARRAGRAYALVCLVCALCMPGAPASAQNASAESASYRELVDQALSEFKHRHWPEARILFTRAHTVQPNARTLRGLGVVSFEMREYVAAIGYLQQALEDNRQPLTDAQRTECLGLIVRSRTYVGTFTLTLSPAEATAQIDGAAPVRDAEGLLILPFGEHVLSGSAPGYQDATQRFSVQGGERSELSLALALIPPAPPPVAEQPREPAARSQPPPAPVTRVEKTGGLRYTWVALGAGAVFGGLAAGAWFMGQEEYDRADARCQERAATASPCAPGRLNTDKLTRYERITNAGLGLAAASVVATVTLMAVEWPRERTVTLSLGPQSIALRGAF